MQVSANIHLSETSAVHADIATDGTGRRYIVLTITGEYAYPSITIFPAGPEFLDKLANECERVVREFVGDVPAPSQAYIDEIGERQSAEVTK